MEREELEKKINDIHLATTQIKRCPVCKAYIDLNETSTCICGTQYKDGVWVEKKEEEKEEKKEEEKEEKKEEEKEEKKEGWGHWFFG